MTYDCVKNAEVLQRLKEDRNTLCTIKIRKTNWIGHIMCRNWFPKGVNEVNI